jgi:hypothetical protein
MGSDLTYYGINRRGADILPTGKVYSRTILVIVVVPDSRGHTIKAFVSYLIVDWLYVGYTIERHQDSCILRSECKEHARLGVNMMLHVLDTVSTSAARDDIVSTIARGDSGMRA